MGRAGSRGPRSAAALADSSLLAALLDAAEQDSRLTENGGLEQVRGLLFTQLCLARAARAVVALQTGRACAAAADCSEWMHSGLCIAVCSPKPDASSLRLPSMQAGQALAGLEAVVLALTEAAVAALEGASSSGLSDTAAAQLREAVRNLQGQMQVVLRSLPADAPPEQRAAQLRQLLRPAADLAALMQQCYALPAVAAERRLAQAQAAAGRCCAYLRCANLGGEGGPAAGEGVGSKRCRCAAGPGQFECSRRKIVCLVALLR